ncbi:Vacuolar protein sorting-associated protein 29 [Malassezia brasiliensis]|uniref:Vacuolar protein sorting-associated protein 29 n=1 Tax=Malassezia brasiliensis TaxID=1821822 RepID=A0AAF0IPQ8_9BASI|nr:Vacuolar protein sorting-associated protein 29 [Malassezia brasiliensis]
MLVLVIGDLLLPYRALDLPAKFRKLLVPGKIQQVVCTGNVCDRQTLDYLRSLASEFHMVKGDYDEVSDLANLVLQYPPVRIGVVHGHQVIPAGDKAALASLARSMNVDVLLSGYTHQFEAYAYEGRFFINPGSATGAWSTEVPLPSAPTQAASTTSSQDTPEANKATETGKPVTSAPSEPVAPEPDPLEDGSEEMVLDIQGAVVVIYIYQLINNEVKVEKLEYRKPVETTDPAAEA